MESVNQNKITEESPLLKYTNWKEIGAGAFANVYKATDTKTGEVVAIKFMKDISKNNYTLLKTYRELKIMKKLS